MFKKRELMSFIVIFGFSAQNSTRNNYFPRKKKKILKFCWPVISDALDSKYTSTSWKAWAIWIFSYVLLYPIKEFTLYKWRYQKCHKLRYQKCHVYIKAFKTVEMFSHTRLVLSKHRRSLSKMVVISLYVHLPIPVSTFIFLS